jgi:hypothetical protein
LTEAQKKSERQNWGGISQDLLREIAELKQQRDDWLGELRDLKRETIK